MARRNSYKRGKRTPIAKKRRTRFSRTMNKVASGYYKRKAKSAAKRAIVRKGIKWGILGF